MVDGHIEPASPELKGQEELVYDDLFADESLDIPEQLADLVRDGVAKVVRVEDQSGSSVLNELESFAYSTDALTFITHKTGQQEYIYCLVGERVSTDKTWRGAGKAITALQKILYARAKAGRPPNLERMKAAIRLRSQGGPLKEKAFSLAPNTPERKLESSQHYLSEIGRKLKPSAEKKSPRSKASV